MKVDRHTFADNAVGVPDRLRRNLQALPNHLRLVERTSSVLRCQRGVVGLVVSGSAADSTCDHLSDIDLLVVTSAAALNQLWTKRHFVETATGSVVFRIDLLEVMPTSCAAYFSDGTKLHLTYRSITSLVPDPEYRHGIILFDPDRRVRHWLRCCRSYGTSYVASLIQSDERFWFWLLQGSAKIKRGELWAAYDTLQILRSIVVSATDWTNERAYEGYRRLETRWRQQARKELEQTVVDLHKNRITIAYQRILSLYQRIRKIATHRYAPQWTVSPQGVAFATASVTNWLSATSEGRH